MDMTRLSKFSCLSMAAAIFPASNSLGTQLLSTSARLVRRLQKELGGNLSASVLICHICHHASDKLGTFIRNSRSISCLETAQALRTRNNKHKL